jgi:hypothetical protein
MARRTDPERIHQARRAAVLKLLIQEDRLSVTVAEAWIREWEAEARRLGVEPSSEYWTFGLEWINRQLERTP